MKIAFGVSWNDSKKGQLMAVAAGLALSLSLLSLPPQTIDELGRSISMIVRAEPGEAQSAQDLVQRSGGDVGRSIGIIDGFEAKVPANRVDELVRSDSVRSLTPNAKVELLHSVDGYDPTADMNSMWNIAQVMKADQMWKSGYTGAGVDVALIDSGVVPVQGLTAAGKVVNGPDLSFESQSRELRYLDSFGHGTHMAGIVAGIDDPKKSFSGEGSGHENFAGIAPGARIVNVKVAGANGATDVSQVLAAIDWVVQHKNDNGMNIRVLNLSFGTDGTQDYVLDPLTYAAEVAWRHGIVVVVAAGNSQFGSSALNNPAYDPFVVAVGAQDPRGTRAVDDDDVPSWSARNDKGRNVDVVAPGKSVVSLRNPGSYVDQTYSSARVGTRFVRGSGTSQSAAAVSGAVALLLQQRPGLTPDQVKMLLMSTASTLPQADAVAQGRGAVNLRAARDAATPSGSQNWTKATGTGSIGASRGTVRLRDGDKKMGGEIDIFGAPFDSTGWAARSLAGNSWSGGVWNGNSWSGNSWSGNSWSGNSWSVNSWSGNSWSGNSWSGNSWSGNSWSGNSWSGNSWSGNSWSGNSWSGSSWG